MRWLTLVFLSSPVLGLVKQPVSSRRVHALFAQQSSLESLPLPPSRKPGPFRKIRDFIEYVKSPQKFVETRAEELGPVFMTNLFFKPAVVVGGRTAVEEFVKAKELSFQVIHSALPDIFDELHTEWGSLNLDSTDIKHKQARSLFSSVLSAKALAHYTPYIEQEIDKYLDDMITKVNKNPDESFYIYPELAKVILQCMSRVFSGKGLSEEEIALFEDYNNGLLAPSRMTGTYKKGKIALDRLTQEMKNRWQTVLPANDGPGKFYFDQVKGLEGFESLDRRAVGSLLMIWGSYSESAALASNALILLYENGFKGLEEMRNEALSRQGLQGYERWKSMEYTYGVLRESLRLIPQVGGGFRYSEKDFALAGYRIPAGTTVTLEPRINNKDPSAFVAPATYEPERWMPKDSASKCPFRGTSLNPGPSVWFPGGTGAHGCPGIPLAELIGCIFLGKLVEVVDSWEYSGEGLTKDGHPKFTEIPMKAPSRDFALKFKVKPEVFAGNK